MIFGGIQKTSLIDYPGKLTCVLFLSGCNYRCPYCHNPDLATGLGIRPDFLTESWFFEFLERRKGFLEGVVISGGEPTLQEELAAFCRKLKDTGFAVKIDTNGSRPRVLQQLIGASLVDYVAMDIKADPGAYRSILAGTADGGAVLSSIRILMDSTVDYEFRTTCVRPLVDGETIEKISSLIKGSKRYALQPFHAAGILDPDFFKDNLPVYTPSEMQMFQSIAQTQVDSCIIRGGSV